MNSRTTEWFTHLLPLLLLIVLASCSGQPDRRELPPLKEVSLQELDAQLEQGRPVRALESSDQLYRRGLISADELAAYHERIAALSAELLQHALNESDWEEALRLRKARSLAGIAATDDTPTQSELILRLLAAEIEEGDRVAAYSRARNALRDGYITPADLERTIEDAAGNGYEGYARQLAGVEGDPTSLREDLPGIVDSTVTIWVNRGIRVESGMGYPDRVIGSGFFIDYRGFILTNYHVIESEVDPEYEGFSRLFIRRGGASSPKIPARVVGWDPLLDIALLKAEITPEFVFIPGEGDLKLGEPIYAIGSPGGLEKTITSGIVSASDRRLLQLGDAVQIDVPINQGNSGGPLLNETGMLVGVVFAGIEIFEGINFAIPVYWLERIIPMLYEEGEVAHAWIGAALHEDPEGLTVLYASPGSPARRTGVSEGERLLSINGVRIRTLKQAHRILVGARPGGLARTVWRDEAGNEIVRNLELQERPRSPILDASKRDADQDLVLPLFGMGIRETGSTLWEKGYIITKVYPGSVADETGLSVNDPFYWRGFTIDEERKIALMQMIIKKRKAGFLESSIQLGAYIEVDYFI